LTTPINYSTVHNLITLLSILALYSNPSCLHDTSK